jgi:large subunit ribosomal protein L5
MAENNEKAGAAEPKPEGEEGKKKKSGGGEKREAEKKGGEKKGGGGGGGDKKKKGKEEAPEKPIPPPRLWARYRKEIVPQLKKDLNLRSTMEVPRLQKIVVNMGLGEAIKNNKILEAAVEELGLITGQKAVVTKAKKSVANFKLREGMPIGAMVTLRRNRMWEFLDRLVAVALPRVRDFKGVSPKAFDGRGNYTLGLKEQIIFPEIDYDKVDKARGMNICIVTTARNDEQAKALLEALGLPFAKRGGAQAQA